MENLDVTKHLKTIAKNIAEQLEGSTDEESMLAELTALATSTNSIIQPAKGTVVSLSLYLHITLTIDPGAPTEGPYFTGNAGGLSIPGGGLLDGHVSSYATEPSSLFETVSLMFDSLGVYTWITFFNSSSKIVGFYYGPGFTTTVGKAGGTGSWTGQKPPEENLESGG